MKAAFSMSLACARSLLWERQPGQSLQEPRQIIIAEPARSYVVPADLNPLARLQGYVVTEGPLFRAGGLCWKAIHSTQPFWSVNGPSRMVIGYLCLETGAYG